MATSETGTNETFERTGPLAGLTIIDCTMALAGPFGTALLADLGADVIKVEPPAGDGARSTPPTPPDYANPNAETAAGVDYGGQFASINRNKRGIVLDLKTDRDKARLLGLCERADAIVENMRSGVMDRLGVGYEVMRERNPSIVYGAIRGFGDPRTGTSPYADWPAYDIVAQAMSGFAHITGPDDGASGYPAGVSVGDIYPGTLMALGIVSAVLHARETGVGQFLDVAMYDAMLALNETAIANFGFGGRSLGPRGQHHPNLMPFGIFPASDGGLAIACPGNNHWHRLCDAMGRPDMIDDARCSNTYVRARNQVFVEAQISAWTTAHTRAELMAKLGGKIPCGPVNTAEDIFADPHVAAREMITRFALPGENPEVAISGTAIKFTNTKAGFYRRPPKLGEHTNEVLAEFGLGQRPDA